MKLQFVCKPFDCKYICLARSARLANRHASQKKKYCNEINSRAYMFDAEQTRIDALLTFRLSGWGGEGDGVRGSVCFGDPSVV